MPVNRGQTFWPVRSNPTLRRTSPVLSGAMQVQSTQIPFASLQTAIPRSDIESGEYICTQSEMVCGSADPMVTIAIDEQATVLTMAFARNKGVWPRPATSSGSKDAPVPDSPEPRKPIEPPGTPKPSPSAHPPAARGRSSWQDSRIGGALGTKAVGGGGCAPRSVRRTGGDRAVGGYCAHARAVVPDPGTHAQSRPNAVGGRGYRSHGSRRGGVLARYGHASSQPSKGAQRPSPQRRRNKMHW